MGTTFIEDSVVSGKENATLIISASNSKDTTTANYICDGTADESEINSAIGELP